MNESGSGVSMAVLLPLTINKAFRPEHFPHSCFSFVYTPITHQPILTIILLPFSRMLSSEFFPTPKAFSLIGQVIGNEGLA